MEGQQESIWKTAVRALAGVAASIANVVLRATAGISRIRIGLLPNYGRIGHLSRNLDLYLRRRYLGDEPDDEEIYILSGPPANKTLFRMFQREISLFEAPRTYQVLRYVRNQAPTNPVWKDLPVDVGSYAPTLKAPTQIEFTDEEEREGKEDLRKIGVHPGRPFVCFHVRDSAYLDQAHPRSSQDAWSYHDFRNSSLENCIPAVRALADQGIFALRMGAEVETDLNLDHPRIIDYARRHRSAFRDIYLLAKCKFFLGTTSGLHATAAALGTPVAGANWVILSQLGLWSNRDLFIPKKLYSEEEGRLLTFPEIIGSEIDAFTHAYQYEEAGIRPIENTADEILHLSREMNRRLDGTWETSEKDEALQARWWKLFPDDHPSKDCPARIGAHFLRDNEHLLEP